MLITALTIRLSSTLIHSISAENEDFEVTSPCVTFHGDEQLHNFPHCVGIGIHIIDDDVNEADQVFIIHLRPPNLLNYNVNMFCNVSLGWIKDNDREWIDQYCIV